MLLFLVAEGKKGYKQRFLEFELLIPHGTSKIAPGCGKWHGLFGLSVRSFPANAPILLCQPGLVRVRAFASIFA